MRVLVVGAGYVGLSNAVLFARNHDVVIVDIDAGRVAQLQQGVSPIADADLQAALRDGNLRLRASLARDADWGDVDMVVVATPTNYDPDTNSFDTSSVESVIATTRAARHDVPIVIRSTIPVGFVDRMRAEHDTDLILFSPEFLREGRALHDNLHPSRIVVGDRSPSASAFADLLTEGAQDDGVPVVLTSPREAEAIKLFANTYLAMRVAFFNELDSYALAHGLASRDIVEGVSLDPRIGDHYNNPSFGYGGYCLPKDTRQLLANYDAVPQDLVRAVVDANQTRKDFIADRILASGVETVGVHRLSMKTSSDNFRESSVLSVIRRLVDSGTLTVLVHEPTLDVPTIMGCEVVEDLDDFLDRCDLVVANRMSPELLPVADKVFTRDLYNID